jgi:hypothetical protein
MSHGEQGSGAIWSKIFGPIRFYCHYIYPLPFTVLELLLTPISPELKPSAAAKIIAAGEEELHCLDLAVAVLASAAEVFTPPPL